MKLLVSALSLIAAVSTLQAGGFGGPPPFTNGSPLLSGVDGTYQANAHASNTTGVIRFSYSGNNQTSTLAGNSYVIFSEGLTFSGPVIANITISRITGVLNRNTAAGFSNTALTGFFNAKIDTGSSTYSFQGKGFMQTFIQDPVSLLFSNLFSKDLKIKGVRNSQTPL
ncbi:MAG: hypothetical protein WEB60_02825 [Terrimicrobiaceae bacterium]